MDDRSFMHSVLPVIRWIDDRQEKRERPIIYIGVETLRKLTPQGDDDAYSSAMKAVRLLIEHYQVFFLAPAKDFSRTEAWLEKYVSVPAWGHTVYTNQRQLLYGDYLVEAVETKDSMATRIAFGSDTFKTWDDIIEYFGRLGGQ